MSKGLGIEMVYQHLALCRNLDVTSNLFLGREVCRSFFGLFNVLSKRAMDQMAACATAARRAACAVKGPASSSACPNTPFADRKLNSPDDVPPPDTILILGVILGIGLSWSLIRARLTGQVEVQ